MAVVLVGWVREGQSTPRTIFHEAEGCPKASISPSALSPWICRRDFDLLIEIPLVLLFLVSTEVMREWHEPPSIPPSVFLKNPFPRHSKSQAVGCCRLQSLRLLLDETSQVLLG